MTDAPTQTGPKTPWHLWVIGILALLWNSFGALDFAATNMAPQDWLGAAMGYNEDQIAYFLSLSWWENLMWGVGTWGALLGTIALLLRRRLAVWLLLASLIGASVYFVNAKFFSTFPEGLDPGFFPYVIVGIAAALLVYAIRMKRSGVLR